MSGIDVIAKLLSSIAKSPDGTRDPGQRNGQYGERHVLNIVPTKHLLAEEGSYFVSTNPTIGTGVAAGIQTTFSDTLAAFVIRNTDVAGGKSIYLDYIKLLCTVAPASATSLQYAGKLEPATPRAATAAVATLTPVNVNGGVAVQPMARIDAFTGGAWETVPAASTSARIVSRGALRGVIAVIGDELILAFGSVDPAGGAGAPSSGSRQGGSAAPVVIPPGGSYTLHLWFPANAATGPSFEYEIGHYER